MDESVLRSKLLGTSTISVREAGRLVGRQTEVSLLQATLEGLQAGQGRILLVEGEAGIGKTRLVREFAYMVRLQNGSGLLGSAHAKEQQTPYFAWRDIISAYFGLDTNDPLSERQTKVQQVVQTILPEHTERLPLLNDILNLRIPDTALTAALDPQLRQQNVALLLTALLRVWTQQQPLVLVFEDVHWLDSLSWELVVHVARSLLRVQAPFILLLATRIVVAPEPAARHLATLQALAATTVLKLGTLLPAETITLVTQRLRLSRDGLPPEVGHLIVQRSQGNPYLAEELVFTLRDLGFMRIDEDTSRAYGWARSANRCTLTTSLEVIEQTLPPTVQGLLQARIERLPYTQQMTLKAAAVIGRAFTEPLLFHTLSQFLPMQRDELQAHLSALAALELTPLDIPEPATYFFKHTILHETVSTLVQGAEGRLLHAIVAGWYEKTYAADGAAAPYYTLLVHHYHHAANHERECRYAILAAERAAAQYANTEALIYLDRALTLTSAQASAERYRLLRIREEVYDRQGAREAQMHDLRVLAELTTATQNSQWQAEVALRQSNYALVKSNYLEAALAAQGAIAAAHAGAQSELVATGLLHWGRALLWLADYPAARQQLEQALTLARLHHLPRLEAECLRNLGIVGYSQGDYTAAQAFTEQALQCYHILHDQHGEALTLNSLANTLAERGEYTLATTYYEQALNGFEATGDQRNLSIALCNLGQLCRDQGLYERASTYYIQGLDIYQTIDDQLGVAWCLGNLGWTYLDQGDYTQATANFTQVLHTAQTLGDREDEGWMLASLAFLSHLHGQQDVAATYCQQVLQLAQETGNRYREAEALTTLGHALVGRGQLTTARENYSQALAIWQEIDLPHRAMEARAGLARCCLMQGDVAEALAQVEAMLLRITTHPLLTGADEPLRVYLICYQVLRAARDARAPDILQAAGKLLDTRAVGITNPQLKYSFLEGVPAHREIRAQLRSTGQVVASPDP